MRVEDYARLDASEIAQLVTAGEVSATEILSCAIAAIEGANPHLNAVVSVYAEQASAEIARGLPRGPLHGVPILLKDLGCPAAGTRTTFGSRLFADATTWTHDCAFIDRVRKAGAVILGRTNSCEFGISLVTEPRLFGPTQNPHRPGLSPGGSSGGSAAAVASGMVPVAHATDGCGSIRVPASHCGIFGLKPSRGRISFGPDAGESWAGMSVNGALTRTVRDSALMLDIVSVPYPGDPYFIPRHVHSFRELILREPRPLRIGMPAFTPQQGVDRECIAAMRTAARLCESLGHEIVPIELDFDLSTAIEPLTVIWSTQLWALLQARYEQLSREPDGDGVEPLSWKLACKAAAFSAADHLAAARYVHGFGRRFAQACDRCDVVMTPVAATPPSSLGTLKMDGQDVAGYLAALFRLYPFTVQYNLSGRPAMSVPIHWTPEGLPVGIQFGAAIGEEALLLQLATQLEGAAPWCERIPASPEIKGRACL